MVSHDFWVLLAMLLYFIVVVVIGFVYAKKSNQSTENYFLGGRRLGRLGDWYLPELAVCL